MIVRFLLALLLGWAASPALADMTAIYVGPNKALTMKIEIAANGDVRGETSNPNSYFITRAGHGYMIQASFKGPAVMRMEDISVVMGEQLKRLMPNMPPEAADQVPPFDLSKGSVVTIRGRQGTAYYMGKTTVRPPSEQPVVVISTDPALAPLAVAMQRQFSMSIEAMGKLFGKASPFSQMLALLRDGAPLLFTGLELDSVENKSIPASEFSLPAEPLSLDEVRKNMGVPAPSTP